MMDSRKIYRMLVASPFLLLLLLIVYCFYTGRGQHRKPTHEELDQALLRYMQSKYAIYKDEFTIDKPGDEVWASADIFYSSTNKYELKLDAKKYKKRRSDEKVVVRYNYEKGELYDNYMSFVLRDEVEQKFKEVFDRIYSPETYELVMIVPNTPWEKENFGVTITAEEYLENILENNIHVCVARDSRLIDQDLDNLLGELKEKSLAVDANIYYMTEEQLRSIKQKTIWADEYWTSYNDRVWILLGKMDEDYYIRSVYHNE